MQIKYIYGFFLTSQLWIFLDKININNIIYYFSIPLRKRQTLQNDETKYNTNEDLCNKYRIFFSFFIVMLLQYSYYSLLYHPLYLERQKGVKLTFGADQTAVVANGAEVFKHKHCHGHHSQAHHKHHDPDCWAVGFWRRKGNKHKGLKYVSLVHPASKPQPAMAVTMCCRRIAEGRTKDWLMLKWEVGNPLFGILCWILLFGVWKRD